MGRQLRISDSTHARLKALSARSRIPMARLVSDWITKNESHKVEVKALSEDEKDTTECGECEEVIPEGSLFCAYCGVEFEEEEED